mmetsp:Transcript_48100/g.112459  ORF Transcript_48100/g.112459 Transcript_48100/m.112459 type:complete len:120 (+) Transcript_48100:267-626(+)
MLPFHKMYGIQVDSSSQLFARRRRNLTDLRAIAGMAVRGVSLRKDAVERAPGAEAVVVVAQTPALGVEGAEVEVVDALEAPVIGVARAKHARASVTTVLNPAGEYLQALAVGTRAYATV